MLGVVDLGFRYHKSREELFGGLSYAFVRGAVTGVTGPSGRGKSTLLYILGLMLRPTAGEVHLDGTPVSGAADGARSRLRSSSIGFVFQDAALDPTRRIIDSVIEPGLYAGWSRARAKVRARELLREMDVADRAEHKPGQISGGQAQRVAVCRALLTNPPVILADEPTGNLDRASATVVLDAIVRAKTTDGGRPRTVVVATHDPFVLERCDEVLAL